MMMMMMTALEPRRIGASDAVVHTLFALGASHS
jgi:hypothetical protein